MAQEQVPIKLTKIMQTRTYTVMVVGTDEKHFAIYVEPVVGRLIQDYLSGGVHPRPLTYDLILSLLQGIEARPIQVVINDVEDTIYFARLFLEQERDGLRHILEIDARPSDCLTLALVHQIPIFCAKSVLEQAIPIDE